MDITNRCFTDEAVVVVVVVVVVGSGGIGIISHVLPLEVAVESRDILSLILCVSRTLAER